MRLEGGTKSDISRFRLPSELIFCFLAGENVTLPGSRRRYLLGSRDHANTFLPIVRPKMRQGRGREAMSEAIGRRVVEIILCLLPAPKCK